MADVKAPLGLWLGLLWLRGRGIACDQAEALPPGVEAVAAEDAPDSVI